MVSRKIASRRKGLLKGADLRAAYVAAQARNREGAAPESGRRGRLGDVTAAHPPPAPALPAPVPPAQVLLPRRGM